MLVKCLNCGIIWRRVTADSNPGGTVANEDIQMYCPKCGSNACRGVDANEIATFGATERV